MPINVNIDNKISELYKLADTNTDNVKKLNQSERKTFMQALKCLQGNSENFPNEAELDALISKLRDHTYQPDRSSISSKQSFQTEGAISSQSMDSSAEISRERKPSISKESSLKKSISNVFGTRIGIDKIIKEMKVIKSQVQAVNSEIDGGLDISKKINNNEKNIEEWREAQRYQKEDAAPLYEEIKEFFKLIPDDQKAATPYLIAQLTIIQEKIEKAKLDKKPKDYIDILEKQYKKSIENLIKYQGNNFENELKHQRIVYQKAYDFCFDPEHDRIAEEDINKYSKEIEELRRKQTFANLYKV